MKTTSIVRHRLSALLIAAFAFATTACDMGSSIGSGGSGSMCLMGGCGGGGGYGDYDIPNLGAADSIVIAQRDTTITLGDSLLVRVRVHVDSGYAAHMMEPFPYPAARVEWLYAEGTVAHVWKVKPDSLGAIMVRAYDYSGKADTLRLQVTPRTP